MKHPLLILTASALLLTSCAAHYVATDSVTRQLDGTRCVLATANHNKALGRWRCDTLAVPQVYDFRSEKDTMRYAYTLDVARGGWTTRQDSLGRMLQPEVTVGKSFRWFTTRYRYTARFPQLDSLPVPVGDYLTPDEQRLLLAANEMPSDWTGTDLYALLDKLNTKYVKWWDHCLFEKEMDAYAALCDSAQRALLAQYHDTLLAIVLDDLPDRRQSLYNACKQFPELAFVGDMTDADNRLTDVACEWAYDHWELDTRVLWRTALPGGRMAEHMVSADRMILGDYLIEEHSDVLNWWAIALTLLAAVAAVLAVYRRHRI